MEDKILFKLGEIGAEVHSITGQLKQVQQDQRGLTNAVIEHGEKLESLPCTIHEHILEKLELFTHEAEFIKRYRGSYFQAIKWIVPTGIALCALITTILLTN